MEAFRLPTSRLRPPQQDSLDHILTIQHRHDHTEMATLSREPFRTAIERPHPSLERRLSHSPTRIRSNHPIRNQWQPSGTTSAQPHKAHAHLNQYPLRQRWPRRRIHSTRRQRSSREIQRKDRHPHLPDRALSRRRLPTRLPSPNCKPPSQPPPTPRASREQAATS
jgi:hypothetical protein